jgi:hypothetical protein
VSLGALYLLAVLPVAIFWGLPGRRTDPGIRPRFRELTGLRSDLEIVEPEGAASTR